METLYLYELVDIDLEEIDKGKILIGEVSPEKLKSDDLIFNDFLKFYVEVEIKPKKIFVKGDVEAKIILTCDRCLENFNFFIKDSFNYVFFLTKLVVDKKNKEFKLKKEDLEIDFLEENILPLKDIIFGQIFLNIPIKKICRENCKGLCPICGCNLNVEKCDCKTDLNENPFAKLKEMLK